MKSLVAGVSGGATAAVATACMAVVLQVHHASAVEFTSHEILRVDRVQNPGSDGVYSVERHGDLLHPGTTTVQLEPGVYHFRSTSDVSLATAQNGSVQAVVTPNNKDDWPSPNAVGVLLNVKGIDESGAAGPKLTVLMM